MTTEGSNISDMEPVVLPASQCHSQLRAVFIWPFIFVVIYTVLGVVGNAIVLYIYTYKWKRTKSRIFILMLAFLNFVNSIFNMPTEAYILWHQYEFDIHWLCKTTRGVTFVINNVCACVFVAIAIDRILVVYKPFKRQILTSRYAKLSCFVAFVVGFGTSWPGFVFYGTANFLDRIDDVNIAGRTCYISDKFAENTKWPSIFNSLLFVLMIIVFVLLTVLYIIIGRKIYQVTKFDSLDQKLQSKRISANKSILTSIRKIALGNIMSAHKTIKPSTGSDNTDIDNVSTCEASVRFEQSPKYHDDGQQHPRKDFSMISRRFSTTNTSASRGNTITMMMITIAFIVSFLPYCVIVSLRYFDKTFYINLGKNSKIAYHVFLRTYFLNSVINPIIYSFVNKEFRQTTANVVRKLLEHFKKCR